MFSDYKENVLNMKVSDMLEMLTDENMHTARVLIESILLGDGDIYNDMLIVALHHQLKGELTGEMNCMRNRARAVIKENLYEQNNN